MIKKMTSSIVIVMLLLQVTACSSVKKTRYEAEFLVLFDTMTKIVAYMDSKEAFSRQSQLIYDRLKEYHELYDIYNNYEGINNMKTINDEAGKKPVKVDKKIIDLLKFSKQAYLKTNGKVNIALGAVLKIWHDYRTEGNEDPEHAKLPPMDELKEAAKHTDINKMIIDEANSTVFLEDPKMSLDVGSVGKGYATEMVSQAAEQNGFTSGLISVGGNVRAIGTKGGTKKLWNVGVQNPDQEAQNSVLKIAYLKDMALVTSGNYERYYTVNGKIYHHIVNPETLFPSDYFTAVTIVCKNSGMADALSTAVFNMTFEEGMKFIDNLPGTGALWVFNDGQVKYSTHFEQLIQK